MANRPQYTQVTHDQVVRASATTYGELVKQGYKVSTNPNGEKNQSIGGPNNRLYPDVIVWKPNASDPTSGTAAIIEEIETDDSVTIQEAQQWKKYGDLGVGKFLLIVPGSRVSQALQIVQQNSIKVTEIWYYQFAGGNINFTKYITL